MALVEATINLDFLNVGERTEVPDADLGEQPVAYLLERGYLKIVEDESAPREGTPQASAEVTSTRRARRSGDAEG